MTTIAANRVCIAADQRITSGNAPARTTKIRRIRGSLFAACGKWSVALVFLEWLNTKKRDKLRLYELIPEGSRYDFDVLELSPDGIALWDGWGTRTLLLDDFYAIGSGGLSAMQAMKRGVDPEGAIGETFSLDEASGGSVDCQYLKRRG